MSNLAFLLPLVFEFFKKKSYSAPLHEQISRVTAKLLTGLILTAVIIFSLIIVGQHVRTILLGFEYGIYLSLAAFSLTAILAAVFLIILFRKDKKVQSVPSGGAEIDFEKIVAQFCAGLAAGMNKPPADDIKTKEEIL